MFAISIMTVLWKWSTVRQHWMPADLLTKPTDLDAFKRLTRWVLGNDALEEAAVRPVVKATRHAKREVLEKKVIRKVASTQGRSSHSAIGRER